MIRTVTVTTGARLHFGPLSYRPAAGRHFGGVGLMVQEPSVQLVATGGTEDTVTGDPAIVERVRGFVATVRQRISLDRPPVPSRIDVARSLPLHSGLGSGTQLGMAVAHAMTVLADEQDLSPVALAGCVARGRRSAVGVYGFTSGGLIVDAGKRLNEDLGALCCRLPFPSKWRVLLLTPERGSPGLSGKHEERAFEQLGSMPAAMTDFLCRIVVTELLPAVQSADFDAFSDAVSEYGNRVGQFFSPVQGGTFGDARTDDLVDRLTRMGLRGVGQTSWGPTLFAFVPSQEQGEDLMQQIQSERRAGLPIGRVLLVSPMNTGAVVTESDCDVRLIAES